MAMEKLILKSVLWGADKVPDSWFEKVPGGYYSPQEGGKKDQRTNSSGDRRGSSSRDNRSSSRRYSTQDSTRYRPESNRDNEYQSEGQQRRSTTRGDSTTGREQDRYRESDRRGSRRGDGNDRSGQRRRRSFDDTHPGYADDFVKPPRDPRDPNESRAPYPRASYDPGQEPSRRNQDGRDRERSKDRRSSFVPPVALPTSSLPIRQSQPQPTPSSRQASVADGYVPYAHIYGGQPNDGSHLPPPPAHRPMSISRDRDHFVPPVMPPPLHYRQNPSAQLAPTAEAAGAGAAYTGQQSGDHYGAEFLDPWAAYYQHGYDGEDERISRSSSRSHHRHGRSEHSPSHDSYDSNPQRSHSERRPGNDSTTDQSSHNSGTKSQTRSNKTFDVSQRGLGYSAVGALAGGIVGSEIGRGKRTTPVAIGAALGALGANVLGARERYVDPHQPLGTQLRSPTCSPPPPPMPAPPVVSSTIPAGQQQQRQRQRYPPPPQPQQSTVQHSLETRTR